MKTAILLASMFIIACRPQQSGVSDVVSSGNGDGNSLIGALSDKLAEEQRNFDRASGFLKEMDDEELLTQLKDIQSAANTNIQMLSQLVQSCSKEVESCPDQKHARWREYLQYDTSALYDALVLNGKIGADSDNYTAWAASEPDNMSPQWRLDEDCAVQRATGLWHDESCDQLLPFACKSSKGEWYIEAGSSGKWVHRQVACKGGQFGKPFSEKDNTSLATALNEAGIDKVWINYSDIDLEGFWTGRSVGTDGPKGGKQ
ncbi:MAG: hypothetical protein AB7T49_00815 [Oligoflexales bacterium]